MDEEILIVDAEPNVLEGLQRVLRKDFGVVQLGTVLELDSRFGLAGNAEVETSFERQPPSRGLPGGELNQVILNLATSAPLRSNKRLRGISPQIPLQGVSGVP